MAHWGLMAGAFAVAIACGDGRERTSADIVLTARALAESDATLSHMLAARSGSFARMDGRIVSAGWQSTREGKFDELGVEAGATAAHPTQVGVSRFARLTVSLTLRDASPSSRAEVDDGQVLFRDALAQTDRLLGSTPSSLEDALLVRDARAPRSFTWHAELPAGLPHVAPHAGTLRFEDARGRAALTMAPPMAIDAAGRRHMLAWTWNPDRQDLSVELPDTKLVAYPLLVDPRFDAWSWREHPALGPRRQAVAARDVARAETLLFGGQARIGNDALADTWTRSAGLWQPRFPPSAPPSRQESSLTYDAVRREAVLFGGLGANGDLGDTWVWDGHTWTQRFPLHPPPPRSGAASSFDARRGEVVLFGGVTSSGRVLGDTWVWRDNDWTQRAPTLSPARRSATQMTYDAVRERVTLFGGWLVDRFSDDTWTWDGSNWQSMTTPTAPAPRSAGALEFDAVRGECVLFGGEVNPNTGELLGDTWVWNGASWTLRSPATSPPPLSAPSIAADPQGVLLYGGYTSAVAGNLVGDTWIWNGTTWIKQPSVVTPPPMAGHAVIYDDARSVVVAFGGGDGRTWLWDGISWSASPAAPYGLAPKFAAAYDRKRAAIIAFGGQGSATTSRWDGTSWTTLTPSRSPPARGEHGMAFDARNENVVLFGGRDVATNTAYIDTWTWDGTTWTERLPAVTPFLPWPFTMAYDPTRQAVMNVAPGAVSYLWDGANWSALSTPVAPSDRRSYTLTSFDDAKAMVLFGGRGVTTLDDTWLWSGGWSPLFFTASPQARSVSGMAYDTKHRQILLAGGADAAGVALGDTWTLERLGGTCQSDGDCTGAFCVDGVCCVSSGCGVCATCAGLTPGACSAVTNRDDPDSCALASGKSCDAVAECKLANGTLASDPAQCASGFVADGVCCDQHCDGTCVACTAALKESQSRDGVCDVVRAGTDPRGICKSNPPPSCDTGACYGCLDGTCAPSRAAVCRDAIVVAADRHETNCAPYNCVAGRCLDRCATNLDCAGTGDCTSEGRCVDAVVQPDIAGCTLASRGSWLTSWCAFALALARRRRRRRFVSL